MSVDNLVDLHYDSQDNSSSQDNNGGEDDESKLPLQLAIIGKPNVGNSTLLNALLQEDRVLVGPEAGLTRDSVSILQVGCKEQREIKDHHH
ncbi:hypothetical protein LWI29_036788 [Acer saccharum]|uniref:G domain-containing protein n=1 Tax=Acer saccharum TaxID=4024 RepID=A0AA39VYA9_ACESA|nr:hypothetical protein LWI29_036788 [Acer saccharum]